MKKVLLTAMAIVTLASASAFGMYGSDSSWIDFLVHGNQFRARMNQLGFTLGNGTIKGTFGFKSENGGVATLIKETQTLGDRGYVFIPTVSAGIGYTSDMIGIGLGYSYTLSPNTLPYNEYKGGADYIYKVKHLSVHTPVLTVNALNNNLRIAIPISVAVQDVYKTTESKARSTYVGVSTETQIRYYTGIDAFSLVRLYLKYGNNSFNAYDQDGKKLKGDEYKQVVSSFGFDLRLFFLKTTIGDVLLDPFIKITFDTALDAKGKTLNGTDHYALTKVSADSVIEGMYKPQAGDPSAIYDSNPYVLQILPSLGLNASSDIVTLYLEPSIGYRARHNGLKSSKVEHALRWNAYGEIYITPVKDLEWYFEAEVGNDPYAASASTVAFNASTGITWYLPSLNGAE
ncbi:variable surface family protein [Brachyspira innocens]|uniref:variable surface family protein n=1 Tax=Brachyspira innocens TaxID=13264 RepID=UPI00036C73DD|nr:variable surface family protein [Brachyspira innocens]